MKMLLYCDQTGELDATQLSISAIYYHFNEWLFKNLKNKEDVEVKTLLPEISYIESFLIKPEEAAEIASLNIIPITDKEIREAFKAHSSFHDIREEAFINDLNLEQKEYLKSLIKGKLGGWEPDVIICFPIAYRFLSYIYPQALVLEQENAIFSRPPFMRTLFYDPCFDSGVYFFNKYIDEIKNFKITKEQEEQVQYLKNRIKEIIHENNPLTSIIDIYKKKFDKLVLLPLTCFRPLSDFYEFADDYDLLSHVMENVPENIGVFVTQHDVGGFLTEQYLAYFRGKYKNFIFLNDLHKEGYKSASLNLFEYVDAILNPVSATGFMGLLWDTKIISMANNINDWIKDGQGVKSLVEVLERPPINKNNIIYWYLTHYAVFGKRFGEEDWLYNYFKNRIEKFKTDGITFDYYEQNENIEELSKYIIEHLEITYKMLYMQKQLESLQKSVAS